MDVRHPAFAILAFQTIEDAWSSLVILCLLLFAHFRDLAIFNQDCTWGVFNYV